MGNVESRVKTEVLNNLIVRDVDGVERDTIPVVFSQQRWPFNEDDAPDSDPCLKNILKDSPFHMIGKEINLIIGINRPDILKPRELIEIPNSRSYLTRHSVGWALNGSFSVGQKRLVVNRIMCTEQKEDIETKLREMYREDYKDSQIATKDFSQDDRAWEEIMKNSITLDNNNHYVVDLPLKSIPNLSANRCQVNACFKSLCRKFERNEELFSNYKEFMKLMLTNGFMEKF